MEPNTEKTRAIVTAALHGLPLLQVADAHNMSASGVEKILKRVVLGIDKLTRGECTLHPYSLKRSRQERAFIVSKLDDYLSGELKQRTLPHLTLDSELYDTGLSPRELNPLASHNLSTIGDVMRLSKRELRQLDGLGKASLDKLCAVLSKHGLQLSK